MLAPLTEEKVNFKIFKTFMVDLESDFTDIFF